MFKKLDTLIVKAFIGPFVATFFITLLVLVMQFFWLYIDDFVGKGLGAGIILEFILYQSAALVPLALPLSILMSSIMTFGNLGESFELVAIKAAGISLLRFMRPLFILTVFIGGIAFVFANNVIPVANLKSRTMLSDIVFSKPAFDIQEGVFYDRLSGFAIKVGEKKEDSVIRDVIVYENNPVQDNFVIAESGIMKVSPDKRYLDFVLRDGWRYQERAESYTSKQEEYIRMRFKEYRKQFDLSDFLLVRTDDSLYKNHEKMLSIRQLNFSIDSLNQYTSELQTSWEKTVFMASPFFKYVQMDSVWNTVDFKKDSSLNASVKNFQEWLPDSLHHIYLESARNEANSLSSVINSNNFMLEDQVKSLRKHKIEWHRKITLSLACVVLFLIGAPLGSIIRKGGLGTPLVLAIGFFMVFYFSSTVGEKMAKQGTMTPFFGMWLATFVLTPIGIFLTYKALRDSQLFSKEFYTRAIMKFRKWVNKKKATEPL